MLDQFVLNARLALQEIILERKRGFENKIQELERYLYSLPQQPPSITRLVKKNGTVITKEVPFLPGYFEAAAMVEREIAVIEPMPANPYFDAHKLSSVSFWKILMEWAHSMKNPNTCKARTTFLYKLKKILDSKQQSEIFSKPAIDGAFYLKNPSSEVYSIFSDIETTSQTKKQYHSYIESIKHFLLRSTGYWSTRPTPIFKPDIVNMTKPCAATIANFLVFLESRALKSQSLSPYVNIILARSMIYTKLPISCLLNLTVHEKTSSLAFDEQAQYPVPSSFIYLWKSFQTSAYLFPESLRKVRSPSQEISQRLSRLIKRAGVQLTPSSLRDQIEDLY